jgi:hypothetical protein
MKDSETVFKGETAPMSEEGALVFAKACIAENLESPFPKDLKENPLWFLPSIIEKRIEAYKLPIKFTDYGYVAMMAMVDRPGTAIIVLIDALTRFEGQTIDANKLADLYPNGFYTEETCMDYIDNYLKPKKVKWSEIY